MPFLSYRRRRTRTRWRKKIIRTRKRKRKRKGIRFWGGGNPKEYTVKTSGFKLLDATYNLYEICVNYCYYKFILDNPSNTEFLTVNAYGTSAIVKLTNQTNIQYDERTSFPIPYKCFPPVVQEDFENVNKYLMLLQSKWGQVVMVDYVSNQLVVSLTEFKDFPHLYNLICMLGGVNRELTLKMVVDFSDNTILYTHIWSSDTNTIPLVMVILGLVKLFPTHTQIVAVFTYPRDATTVINYSHKHIHGSEGNTQVLINIDNDFVETLIEVLHLIINSPPPPPSTSPPTVMSGFIRSNEKGKRTW